MRNPKGSQNRRKSRSDPKCGNRMLIISKEPFHRPAPSTIAPSVFLDDLGHHDLVAPRGRDVEPLCSGINGGFLVCRLDDAKVRALLAEVIDAPAGKFSYRSSSHESSRS
jgi:hypothetical protein